MKKVSMARLRDIIRTATLSLISGLVLSIGFVLVYVGVVMSLMDYIEHGGGYPPFVLAGVSAAIGGIVLAVAHVDEELKESKRRLVTVGEIYALAAISFTAFGLFYLVLDRMATPYDGYYIPFILAIASLTAACVSIVGASLLLVSTFWRKEAFQKWAKK